MPIRLGIKLFDVSLHTFSARNSTMLLNCDGNTNLTNQIKRKFPQLKIFVKRKIYKRLLLKKRKHCIKLPIEKFA